jgi:hypothetical protein
MLFHPFDYGESQDQPALLRFARRLPRVAERVPIPGLMSLMKAARDAISACWVLWAVVYYQVFILSFGRTFTKTGWDLELMRRLGKNVVVVLAHGSEARPPYADGSYHFSIDQDVNASCESLSRMTDEVSARVRHLERSATVIVGAPFSSSPFLTKPFVNIFSLGCATKIIDAESASSSSLEERATDVGLRVLHAPSSTRTKGTHVILESIERVRDIGLIRSFTLVQGASNRQVLAAIDDCDIVVDQVWSDMPMASFAAEAAARGRPAIVAGYGLDLLREYVDISMWPPAITCGPDRLEETIVKYARDADARVSAGLRAQEFVREQWNPRAVAERWLRIIEGERPSDWMLDPRTVTYVEGCAQPVERTRQRVAGLVAQFGEQALRLEHHPRLLRAYLELCEERAEVVPAAAETDTGREDALLPDVARE